MDVTVPSVDPSDRRRSAAQGELLAAYSSTNGPANSPVERVEAPAPASGRGRFAPPARGVPRGPTRTR